MQYGPLLQSYKQKVYKINIRSHNVVLFEIGVARILKPAVVAAVIVVATEEITVEVPSEIAPIVNVNHEVSDRVANHMFKIIKNSLIKAGKLSFPAPNADTQKPTFEVFTPDPSYMPYTQQSSVTCHKCGYPNHLAPKCSGRPPTPMRRTDAV